MAYKNVFDTYYEKLVNALPMNDATFMAKLTGRGLLPGDASEQIKAQKTKAEMAQYFLNTFIKPSINSDDTEDFETLITIMEECDFKILKRLAADMRSKLGKEFNENVSNTVI